MASQSLEGLLGFSDADLADNRDGLLGPEQVRRLTWSAIWRLVVGPVLAFAFAAFTIASLDSALASDLFLSFVGLGLVLTWVGFAFLVDALDGKVAFVTAPLLPQMVAGKRTAYFAYVGPVRKRVSRRIYESLPNGLKCHLYYAPGSRSLLSIEPATEIEAKPAHPFGPDSAHVWDRLRVSWVAMTLGVIGVVIAAHGIAVAHPARPLPVEGTIANYVESHGRSTYRDLYLQGDRQSYTPYAENDYGPPLPPFGTMIGQRVVLFVNEGTRNVLAINLSGELHVSDLYVHPENQKTAQTLQAVAAGLISAFVAAAGVAAVRFGARFGRPSRPTNPEPVYAPTPAQSVPSLYVPPSVRPWHTNWIVVPVLALAGAVVGLVIALVTHH